MNDRTIRFFQGAVVLWVLGFILSAYAGTDDINVMGISPSYIPPGPLAYITHALAMLPPAAALLVLLILVPALLMLCVRDLLFRPRWLTALLIWLLYVNLMNWAWLAGSGGQQLIANLLFWNILLALGRAHPSVLFTAFWILRLQVLLAYLVTGLHKLTGSFWLDGTAMGIVSTDPAFGPNWLADHPHLSGLLTWSVLLLQLSFPVAMWFRRTKYVWMGFGFLFHLATALWMDIPEMGFAFIVGYAIWCDEDVVARLPMPGLLGRRADRAMGQ